jgi:hypothetical protein
LKAALSGVRRHLKPPRVDHQASNFARQVPHDAQRQRRVIQHQVVEDLIVYEENLSRADRAECPVNGTIGMAVGLLTVRALLTESALRRASGSLHRFCPDPACDVVYFTENGETYSTADVRVPVWQKDPAGARVLCYCFGEDEAGIRGEINATGASQAVARIREHIGKGRCACEVRNPRGTCCLGDVAAAVRRIAATPSVSKA